MPHWSMGAQGPGVEPGRWVRVTGRKDSPRPQLSCGGHPVTEGLAGAGLSHQDTVGGLDGAPRMGGCAE